MQVRLGPDAKMGHCWSAVLIVAGPGRPNTYCGDCLGQGFAVALGCVGEPYEGDYTAEVAVPGTEFASQIDRAPLVRQAACMAWTLPCLGSKQWRPVPERLVQLLCLRERGHGVQELQRSHWQAQTGA